MSQNKTVFPGLGQEGDYNPNQAYSGVGPEYTRPSAPGCAKGTVFPGMESHSGGTATIPTGGYPGTQPLRSSVKPIVGFLYSISRTGVGEYWPLHIGQNLIGNSSDCDIILGEGTVSQRHANLHINKMKKPEKTEATLSDLGSTNGTLVNENSVSVARPVECFSGDIITIGENYDLLLLLIDTKAFGLHAAENFIDVKEERYYPADDDYTDIAQRGGSTRIEQDFPPHFTRRDSPYDGDNRPTDSTIGLDTSGEFRSGGTRGMD